MNFEITKFRQIFIAIIILNLWMLIMYAIELNDYVSDTTYNPDSIRFFTRFLFYDFLYIIFLILLGRQSQKKAVWIVLFVAVVQNINLGILEYLPLTGFWITVVSLIKFTYVFIKNK